MEKSPAEVTALRKEFPPDPKSKASNVHALSITIGDCHQVAEHNGGIIAKCYFAKKKLVWEVLMEEQQQKKKFEFMWDNITAIRATFHEEEPNTLQVELGKQPLYFAECAPQPRKNTTWESCTDFTNGNARLHRMHTLTFAADGKFEKFYQKLIHFTQDLYLSSRRRFESLEHPYFEQLERRPSSPLNGPLPQLHPEMFTDPSLLNCYQPTAADVNAAMMHGSIPPDPALLASIIQQQVASLQHPLGQPQPQAQAQIEQVYRVMPISVKQPPPPDGVVAQVVAPVPEGFDWTGDEQYYPGCTSSSLQVFNQIGNYHPFDPSSFNMEDIGYHGYHPGSLMASAASLEGGMYVPQVGAGFNSGDADLDLLIAQLGQAAAAQAPAPCGYAIPQTMMAPDYCSHYPMLLQASDNGGYNPSPPPMVQSNYGPSAGYQMPPPPRNNDYQLPPLPNQHGRLPRYQ
ncbi:uncharacterized protein M6B38_292215 [Iris pallida]|uniref:TRF2/HOY1 PH-like domain-containing protein n=1 Tax=Iris pallida TaxID=29817 RepID=A0AAX6HUH2_IRIPA|nr:uncharacterized protein M6B38_292215 [Iris pallida]